MLLYEKFGNVLFIYVVSSLHPCGRNIISKKYFPLKQKRKQSGKFYPITAIESVLSFL